MQIEREQIIFLINIERSLSTEYTDLPLYKDCYLLIQTTYDL